MTNPEVLETLVTSCSDHGTENEVIYASSENVTSVNISDHFLTRESLQAILKDMSSIPLVQHKCQNCGASLTFESNKHIFICKYCGTTYFVGTDMKNDRGE